MITVWILYLRNYFTHFIRFFVQYKNRIISKTVHTILFIFFVNVDTDMNLIVSKYEKKIMTVWILYLRNYFTHFIRFFVQYKNRIISITVILYCLFFLWVDTSIIIFYFMTKNRQYLLPFRSNVPIGTGAYTSSLIPLLLYSFFDTNTYN